MIWLNLPSLLYFIGTCFTTFNELRTVNEQQPHKMEEKCVSCLCLAPKMLMGIPNQIEIWIEYCVWQVISEHRWFDYLLLLMVLHLIAPHSAHGIRKLISFYCFSGTCKSIVFSLFPGRFDDWLEKYFGSIEWPRSVRGLCFGASIVITRGRSSHSSRSL